MRNPFAARKSSQDSPEDTALARRFEWRVGLKPACACRRARLGGAAVALPRGRGLSHSFAVRSVERHAAASSPRPVDRFRYRAPRLASAADPLPHADPRRGAAAARAERRDQAPAGLLLRRQARHHVTRRHRAPVGCASRTACQARGKAQAKLAGAAHRPQGSLRHPFGASARPRRGRPCRRSRPLGQDRVRLHARGEHVDRASPPRCLGHAARLYRHRAHRACRRQRACRRRRRDLPRAVGA